MEDGIHGVVAAAVLFEFVRKEGVEVAAYGDFLQVPGELRDGAVALEARFEEGGVQADLLPGPVRAGVDLQVADPVRAFLVRQAEAFQPDAAVEALVEADQVRMQAGGDTGQLAAGVYAEGGHIGICNLPVHAVAGPAVLRLQVQHAGQVETQQGIVALDAAGGRIVVQRTDDADIVDVMPEGMDAVDEEGVQGGFRQATAVGEDGMDAGPQRGGAEDVDAQDVAEVQFVGRQVQRELDRTDRIHRVADRSREVECAGGALHLDVEVQIVERTRRFDLEGQRDVVGDGTEIRSGFLGGEAAEEAREARGRARQVLELGVQRGHLDVRQAVEVGVRGGGDVGVSLSEDQAVDGHVAYGSFHMASADLQDRRAVDKGPGEVGQGLQRAARALQVAFDGDRVDKIAEILRRFVFQGQGADVNVRPGVAQDEVFEQGAVHEAELAAGREILDHVAGLLPGGQALDVAADLGVGDGEFIGCEVQGDVQVIEVDPEAFVRAVVGEEAVHSEAEILDTQLLDIENIVPGRGRVARLQVENTGEVVVVFLAGFADQVEAAALDGDAAHVQTLLAEQTAQAEGGRELVDVGDGVGRSPAAAVDVFCVGMRVDQLEVADDDHAGGHDLELVVIHTAVHDGNELVEREFGQAGLDQRGLNGDDKRHEQHCQQADNARDDISLFPVHVRCNLQI